MNPIVLAVVVVLVLVLVLWGAPRAFRAFRRNGDTFIPQRVNTCSSQQDVIVPDPNFGFHMWTGQNNHNWTATEQLWDPDSKIQLFKGVLTASASEPVNPDSRIGTNSKVLRWDNPYLSDGLDATNVNVDSPCSKKVSVFDVQPFEADFMIPAESDTTDGTKYEKRYYYQPEYWSRVSGPYGGPYRPLKACTCDSAALENKGPKCASCSAAQVAQTLSANAPVPKESFYGTSFWWQQAGASMPATPGRYTSDLEQSVGIVGASSSYQKPMRSEAAFVLPKETLRSRGNTRDRGNPSTCVTVGQSKTGDDCLTGVGCGLGSTWIDPRFEPGTRKMYPNSTYDAGAGIWAHGGHAGGPTFGAFMPTNFITSGTWNKYVRGAGDGNLIAPCNK